MLPIVTLSINPAIHVMASAEHIASGRQSDCGVARIFPGDGGIDVSRTLHDMQLPTLAIHTAGGLSGARLDGLLESEGVDHHSVPISSETRQRLKVTDSSSGEEYAFVFPSPAIEPHELQAFLNAVKSAAAGSSCVIARGTLPVGVSHNIYAQIANAIRSCGTPFVVDDSGSDRTPTLRQASIDLLTCDADGLSNSAGEALEWPHQQAAWACEMVAEGCARAVVLTHCEEGALMVTRHERVRLQPPVRAGEKVAPVAGAGFLGGVCAGIGDSWPLVESCALGVAASVAEMNPSASGSARYGAIKKLCRDVDISSF